MLAILSIQVILGLDYQANINLAANIPAYSPLTIVERASYPIWMHHITHVLLEYLRGNSGCNLIKLHSNYNSLVSQITLSSLDFYGAL